MLRLNQCCLIILLLCVISGCGGGSGSDSGRGPTPAGSDLVISQPAVDGKLKIGSSHTVAWNSRTNISAVNILFMLESEGVYTLLAENISNSSASTLFFDPPDIENLALWTGPEIKGRLKVESATNPELFDEVAVTIPINLGILYNMVQASTEGDADADNIPDDVETLLGMDPDNKDCDIDTPDSLFDNFEIFGNGNFNFYDLIPDQDGDGLIAPLDVDDNGDGLNDGVAMDTDLDGIPNYLEYYGYTYDWMSGTYNLWDGSSIDEPYFKTDPLQPSTDQDPYDDGMETSGAFMDVSVLNPGDYPMVPAYPNIVVRLEGYAVSLNEDIEVGEGKSIERGTEWSTETTREHSYEFEHGWQVSAGTEFGYDQGGKFVIQLSASYGHTYHNTNTNAVTRSNGGSMADTTEWSRATTTNPTSAANIELYLKVYNMGTSCASNIVPTLTLKIGNMNVETLEPSTIINILEPGGVYPSQPGTFWVVDRLDTGMTVPISLTLEQLRALECGAPVSVVMTQMKADVMLMNEEGQWESAGDWGEYMARCEAVSANMFIEMGDGNFIHHLVYAGDQESSPTVTFGDALVWAAGAGTTGDDLWITYEDDLGLMTTASIQNWDFVFDAQTLIDNGFEGSPLAHPDPEFNLKDLVLFPFTDIVGKKPREQLDGDNGPKIIYAYYDGVQQSIKTLSVDYSGISRMEFVDNGGGVTQMHEIISGSGLFTLSLDSAYIFDESETVRAYTIDPSVPYVEASVQELAYPEIPQPVAPTITETRAFLANRIFRATVNEDPLWPVQSVTATFSCDNRAIAMVKGAPYGDFPNLWYGVMPECVGTYNVGDVTIKATLAEDPNIYAQRYGFTSYQQPRAQNENELLYAYDETTPSPDRHRVDWIDLDVTSDYANTTFFYWDTDDPGNSNYIDSYNTTNGTSDFFFVNHGGNTQIHFTNGFWSGSAKIAEYTGTKDFRLITLEDCKSQQFYDTYRIDIGSQCTPLQSFPYTFIYITDGGRFGKMRLRNFGDCTDASSGDFLMLDAEYVTYHRPSEMDF